MKFSHIEIGRVARRLLTFAGLCLAYVTVESTTHAWADLGLQSLSARIYTGVLGFLGVIGTLLLLIQGLAPRILDNIVKRLLP